MSDDASNYAELLTARYGVDGAIKLAYCYAHGLDAKDSALCDRLASEGDFRVLRARQALLVLRSVRNVQNAARGLR